MNERLEYLRKESKITQDQVARFLSVDRNMVTKLENGTRSSSTTMVDKICGLFLDERQYRRTTNG
ncbi:helix-turn-helix domain-containing protein [Fusicatenibacter sp. CLA-AA-H213]|nr:helix-turn-helix domain-containing protein [Fusicatenibacter sp. CLA-AA-H213]